MLVWLLIGGTKRRVNKYKQSSARIIFPATTDLVAHCQVVGVLLDEGVHLGGAEVVLVHRAAPHRLQLNSVIIIIIIIITITITIIIIIIIVIITIIINITIIYTIIIHLRIIAIIIVDGVTMRPVAMVNIIVSLFQANALC